MTPERNGWGIVMVANNTSGPPLYLGRTDEITYDIRLAPGGLGTIDLPERIPSGLRWPPSLMVRAAPPGTKFPFHIDDANVLWADIREIPDFGPCKKPGSPFPPPALPLPPPITEPEQPGNPA